MEAALDIENCVSSRNLPGGPAPKSVKGQIVLFRRKSKQHYKNIRAWKRMIIKSEEKLLKKAKMGF